MNYFDIYEKLYEVGYHAKGKNHGLRFVPYIVGAYKFKSILEVGCSNGFAVKAFQELNKKAYGIDAANIAIRYATEKFKIPRCRKGSIIDLPYREKSFDAVFSCDVLEHLKECDIDTAINEIVRVSKKHLFLHISPDVEFNKEHLGKAREKYPRHFRKIKDLHQTVWPLKKWIKLIESKKKVKFIKNYEGLLIFEIR